MTLRKVNRRPVTFVTTEGSLTYRRWCLQPVDERGRKALRDATGSTSVFPLDEHLGLDRPPFRITCEAALGVARAGATSTSYAEAADSLAERASIEVSRSTVQRVTNLVGSLASSRELELTDEAMAGCANVCVTCSEMEHII